MIALEKVRDDELIAEGLMRDIARRLQALRKARGYSPTAILERAMVAGLDEEMTSLLRPLAGELSFLVRVKGSASSPRRARRARRASGRRTSSTAGRYTSTSPEPSLP